MEITTDSCVVCVRRFESAVQWNAPRTSPRRCCHRLPPTDAYSSVRLNTLSGIVLHDERGQGCSSRDVSDELNFNPNAHHRSTVPLSHGVGRVKGSLPEVDEYNKFVGWNVLPNELKKDKRKVQRKVLDTTVILFLNL
ncbi:hypothetical protein CDAR_377571 [Caerostris darwini]|uniref:Uncharacterized protein n=1 Tax=Caerostris darwini TaxID=1538125 RepID=A0AAV4QVP6_9ARAC|nr:hypothetical protein CDAR_377571 [Caerostris darwini]